MIPQVIEVPSPLGLRPSGLEDAPDALRRAALHQRLGSPAAVRIDVPPYDDVRDPETGILNPRGIAAVARDVARAVDATLDAGRFPVLLGGDCSIVLGPLLALRRRGYDEQDLFRPRGRYGDIRILPIATTVAGTVLGWGLVTNAAAGWLNWQGYLLSPLGRGGKSGSWAYANLGVLAALALGFVVTLALSRGPIREQEGQPGTVPLANEQVVQA